MTAQYDVIIVGTGAGGGSLLSRLAPSGKRILVLERGDFLPREKDNWSLQAVAVDGKYNVGERWLDLDTGASFQPGVRYHVGGNTKVWGAALLRLRPADFGEVAHQGGTSPAWPLGYTDFEPYYAQAEQLYRVRGHHGEDPTAGPSSCPYAYGPVRHEPRVQELLGELQRAGITPWSLPLGLLRVDQHPERCGCIRCDTCDGFPCLVRGKADAEVIGVQPALAQPNVTLLTGARVTRLETDPGGRSVHTVWVERAGELERYAADLVVLACGAVNSAALLLRSRSERAPAGLANSSGLVGRNYMCHQNSQVFVLSRHENHSVLQKTFAISDFFHASRWSPFPMGLIQPLNRTPAFLLAAQPPPGLNGHPPDYLASHSFEFWITTEDLPDRDNRVSLMPEGEIALRYRPNNLEAHQRLTRQLADLMAEVEGPGFDREAHFSAQRMPISVCSHQCGTLRFGSDPRASVLDPNCKAHDLDNLYVTDASFFPSSGAVNPSLTIIANALRVGDHLLERLG